MQHEVPRKRFLLIFVHAGKMDQVYHSLLALARFFEETEDFWLSDHFYGSCLKTSLKIRGDGRRKESEANCNMGLASEKIGELITSLFAVTP